MKAAVLKGKMDIRIEERETPAVQTNQALVKVKAAGYFDADFGRALHLLANGQIEVDKLVSDVISLDDIVARGFKKLLSPESVLKILVNPEMY